MKATADRPPKYDEWPNLTNAVVSPGDGDAGNQLSRLQPDLVLYVDRRGILPAAEVVETPDWTDMALHFSVSVAGAEVESWRPAKDLATELGYTWANTPTTQTAIKFCIRIGRSHDTMASAASRLLGYFEHDLADTPHYAVANHVLDEFTEGPEPDGLDRLDALRALANELCDEVTGRKLGRSLRETLTRGDRVTDPKTLDERFGDYLSGRGFTHEAKGWRDKATVRHEQTERQILVDGTPTSAMPAWRGWVALDAAPVGCPALTWLTLTLWTHVVRPRLLRERIPVVAPQGALNLFSRLIVPGVVWEKTAKELEVSVVNPEVVQRVLDTGRLASKYAGPCMVRAVSKATCQIRAVADGTGAFVAPQCVAYGGWPDAAEDAGFDRNNRKAVAGVRDFYRAADELQLCLPGPAGRTVQERLFALSDPTRNDDGTERRGPLRRGETIGVTVGRLLLECWADEWSGRSDAPSLRYKRKVPLIQRVPLSGRHNEDGAQWALAFGVLCLLVDRAPELLKFGGVLIDRRLWEQAAERARMPLSALTGAMEVFTSGTGNGPNRTPPLLEAVTHDRWHLSKEHAAEREYLERGARDRKHGGAAGKTSAARKRGKWAPDG
ncbi:MAG: hypothetical protein ABII82_13385 [Verrucomicrobiota bacterium]